MDDATGDYLTALYGALVALGLVAGLFFLRYWRLTRDGFFLWFAGAFIAFAVNWVLLAYDRTSTEHTPYIYAVRLAGFLLMIAGIVLKNRAVGR